MTRKDRSTLSLQMMLVAASWGAAMTEVAEGIWANSPTKILIAAPFAVLSGLFANVLENNLLDTFAGRR